jgi:hypothetical protein
MALPYIILWWISADRQEKIFLGAFVSRALAEAALPEAKQWCHAEGIEVDAGSLEITEERRGGQMTPGPGACAYNPVS